MSDMAPPRSHADRNAAGEQKDAPLPDLSSNECDYFGGPWSTELASDQHFDRFDERIEHSESDNVQDLMPQYPVFR